MPSAMSSRNPFDGSKLTSMRDPVKAVKKSNMVGRKQHRILIATDGLRPAQDALATALEFSWPASRRARAVVARLRFLPLALEYVRAACGLRARAFSIAR